MTATVREAGPDIRARQGAIRSKVLADDATEELLRRWTVWMRGEGQRDRTIEEAVRSLRQMARYVGPLLTAGPEDVVGFLATRRAQATKGNVFTRIKSFYRFALMTGRRDDDPTAYLRAPKIPRGVPRPVTTDQLQRLLEIPMHHRTRVMIMLAAFQGLRVHEVAKLRGEDFDLVAGTLRVNGKGGREDVLPLHPQIADVALLMPLKGWWFPSHIGNVTGEEGPILARSAGTIISNAMRRAGIQGSAHQLRHWYGTNLVLSGADLRQAQTLLRHASLQTTQIYTQVRPEGLRAAVTRLPFVDTAATPPSAPRVEQARRQLWHSRLGATPADVREWARGYGHHVARHGQLPWSILREYEVKIGPR